MVEDALPQVRAVAVEKMHEPELLPVSRSVFDDDFFKSSRRASMAAEEPDMRTPSARGFDSPDSFNAPHGMNTGRPLRVQFTETTQDFGVAEPVVRTPAFTGVATAEPVESDELDIPAFLRRGH